MVFLTEPGICVWDVGRNSLGACVGCRRAVFISYVRNAKPLGRKAAAAPRKSFWPFKFGPVSFSAVNRCSDYFQPSASYLPTLLNGTTTVVGCTDTATTTSGHGCSRRPERDFLPQAGEQKWWAGHVGTHCLLEQPSLLLHLFHIYAKEGQQAVGRRMFWVWIQLALDAAVG